MENTHMQSSPEEIGLAFKTLAKNLKKHPITEKDIIEFFSNKENVDATNSFVNRHPECPYATYIPN